jgi:hypothetical protein
MEKHRLESNIAQRLSYYRTARKEDIYTLDVINFLLCPCIFQELTLTETEILKKCKSEIEQKIIRNTLWIEGAIPKPKDWIDLPKIKEQVGFYGYPYPIQNLLDKFDDYLYKKFVQMEKTCQCVNTTPG